MRHPVRAQLIHQRTQLWELCAKAIYYKQFIRSEISATSSLKREIETEKLICHAPIAAGSRL